MFGSPRLLIAASAALCLTLCVLWLPASAGSLPQKDQRKTPISNDEKIARDLCSPCHTFPEPDILPRNMWRSEIVKMMFIMRGEQQPTDWTSVRLPDEFAATDRFMEAHAPEHLPSPDPWPDASESPVKFTSYGLSVPNMPDDPAVSNVNLVDYDGDGKLDVLGTEMQLGIVFWGQLRPDTPLKVIADVPNPDHITMTDVDKDGVKDLLIADLGRFLPSDHHDGAILFMRGVGGGKYSGFTMEGWPRIADVEPADFNGDGKNDLVVAAFGWRSTGYIAILENQTTNAAHPSFVKHVIDQRPGAIHVIPVDLNKDGKMDFVALISQQYETVVAYLNTGKGDFSFEQKVIYEAPHPNWGSTGIQLVDLDGDGDLDVLYSHGDSFDDGIVKPYHGIQWLENRGTYPFTEHTLATMPGVHRALAADIDGDGDLDIVAGALLAGGSDVDESKLPALVWLEQTKRGVFVKHTIEMGFPRHATLDVADIDGDGRMDIITGYMATDKPAKSWVQVWINQSKGPTPNHATPNPQTPK